MALFVNPGKDWEKNMSEEDIAQMESQGYDVTELRAKRAKSAEEEEKERLREKEERENFKNPTNLNKLAPYLQTPRDMSTSFFKAMAGSAPWLFKDRWKRKYTEAPIVYAAVVLIPPYGCPVITIIILPYLFLHLIKNTFTTPNG